MDSVRWIQSPFTAPKGNGVSRDPKRPVPPSNRGENKGYKRGIQVGRAAKPVGFVESSGGWR